MLDTDGRAAATVRCITGDGDTPEIAAAVAVTIAYEDPPLGELLARFPDAPAGKVTALRDSMHQHFPQWRRERPA